MTIREFFFKPATKGFIIGVLSVAVGVISSLFANKFENEPKWWFFLIGIALVHLAVIIFYAYKEKNALDALNKDNKDLIEVNKSLDTDLKKSQNRITDYNTAMRGIIDLCTTCALNTNKQIHEIIEKGSIDCKTWNFDSASTAACMEIYRSIIENSHVRLYDGNASPNIKISYVKLVDDNDYVKSGEREDLKIALSGFFHPTNPKQKDLGITKKVKESKKHYAALFKEDIDMPVFYNGAANVKEKTGNPDSPYSQYIAFPVRCETVNQNSKLVGLLLVLCYEGCMLSEDAAEVQYLINHFFSTYAYLFLLLFKLDKAMRAMPANPKGNPTGSSAPANPKGNPTGSSAPSNPKGNPIGSSALSNYKGNPVGSSVSSIPKDNVTRVLAPAKLLDNSISAMPGVKTTGIAVPANWLEKTPRVKETGIAVPANWLEKTPRVKATEIAVPANWLEKTPKAKATEIAVPANWLEKTPKAKATEIAVPTVLQADLLGVSENENGSSQKG